MITIKVGETEQTFSNEKEARKALAKMAKIQAGKDKVAADARCRANLDAQASACQLLSTVCAVLDENSNRQGWSVGAMEGDSWEQETYRRIVDRRDDGGYTVRIQTLSGNARIGFNLAPLQTIENGAGWTVAIQGEDKCWYCLGASDDFYGVYIIPDRLGAMVSEFASIQRQRRADRNAQKQGAA